MLITIQLLLIISQWLQTSTSDTIAPVNISRRAGQVNERFKLKFNAGHFPHRLFELLRTYYEDANLRIVDLNPKRFMYEESPHYEQGYVMHEIIDRYKKMVELVVRQQQPSTYVLEAIERLHDIQKIHFEIYHLVNMMHEIPIKWKVVDEFNDNEQEKHDNRMFQEAKVAYEKAEKQEAKEKKKRLRALKKKRMERLASGNLVVERPPAKRNPYNPRWPIDYGWEIDWD